MGSIQQSILGVFCIATAFLLGQYIRTHPSPESLEQQQLQQAAVSPAPSFAFSTPGLADQSNVAKTLPRLPSPAAGFAAAASKATAATVETTVETAVDSSDSRTVTPMRPPVLAERKIDIPDFSQLAASFNNTPLALQGSMPNHPARGTAAVQPNTGSFYVRPAPERGTVPASPEGNSFEQGRAGFAGSRAESVDPPQPTESYQLRERPTSFRKEDFQPRLISKRSAQRTAEPAMTPEPSPDLYQQEVNQPPRKRISLAPPGPDDSFMSPEIPDLEVTLPPKSQASTGARSSLPRNDRAKNQLHSYYDVGTVDSSNTVLERKEFRRSAAKVPTKRRIPFGLNDQGRQELTRIRSRQQTNIDLQTNRFSEHTTRAGDTLQSLSTEYYGRPDFYLDIYLANQRLLRNPAVIPTGIQLKIPRYAQ